MLSITFVSCNIFDVDDKQSEYERLLLSKLKYLPVRLFLDNKKSEYERLLLDRTELGKSRIRKKTDKNTDVGIVLEAGKKLRHGDMLSKNDKIIIVEQAPEKVISIKLKNDSKKVPILIGHIVGNRHRPISIKDNMIYFPIQSESELEVFKMLFSDIISDILISIKEIIFIPYNDAYVH